MDEVIHITAIALIIAYTAFSVWFICKRQSIWASVGASTGLICGGFLIVPIAEGVAAFICWAVVIGIVLAIIGAVCN